MICPTCNVACTNICPCCYESVFSKWHGTDNAIEFAKFVTEEDVKGYNENYSKQNKPKKK